MLPKTMQFAAAPGGGFQGHDRTRDSRTPLSRWHRTPQLGQPLAFKISGTGTLSEAGDDSQGSAPAADRRRPPAVGRDARPGGGLGPPIDAPDPLEKYRWYILGGFALVLAAGAIYITTPFADTAAVPDFGPCRRGIA